MLDINCKPGLLFLQYIAVSYDIIAVVRHQQHEPSLAELDTLDLPQIDKGQYE